MVWSKLLTPIVVPMVLSAMVAFGGPGGVLDPNGGPATEVRREGATESAGSPARGLMLRAATSVSIPGAPDTTAPDGTVSEPGDGDARGGAATSGEDETSPSLPASPAPAEPTQGSGPTPGADNPAPVPTPTPGATPPPAPRHLYLRNSRPADTVSQPVLPLATAAPASATLYNCDTDRDAFAGLLIAKGANGVTETDPTKYQAWRMPALSTNLPLNGTASLTLWSAVQDFNTVKGGRITVFLRDFDGVTHREIAQGSLAQPGWSGGSSSWVEKTVTFPALNYSLPAGHQLEIKLVVDSGSADDMWFAFDTVSYPSRLQLP